MICIPPIPDTRKNPSLPLTQDPSPPRTGDRDEAEPGDLSGAGIDGGGTLRRPRVPVPRAHGPRRLPRADVYKGR
eukprot:23208-Eustigmatos_ZCMA.PRE.1